MLRKTFVIVLGTILVGVQAQATARLLDGNGFNIVYDDALVGLFGTPFLPDGKTLVFTPTNFTAASTTANWKLANSTINFDIVADAGYTLTSLATVERGSYALVGSTSQVFAGGQTMAVDYRDPLNPSVMPLSGGELGALAQRDVTTTEWAASSSHTFLPGATQIRFSLQSLLGALGGAVGGFGFIEKGYASMTTIVSPIPENSTFAMMIVGLGLLGAAAKRRTSKK